jgi:HEAT repeat protein
MRGRQRTKIAWLLIGLSFSTICVYFVVKSHNASQVIYRGIPLSQWIVRSSRGDPEADQALREIAPSAVPVLLEMLASESSWSERLRFRITEKVLPVAWRGHSSLERRLLAAHAFAILGSNAIFAIPQLIKLATNETTSVSASHALANLGELGIASLAELFEHQNPIVRRDAIKAANWVQTWPAFLMVAVTNKMSTDPDAMVRWAAASALKNCDTNTNGVIHALSNGILEETNRAVRYASVCSLENLRNAESLRALRKATNDSDSLIRAEASSLLRRFGR